MCACISINSRADEGTCEADGTAMRIFIHIVKSTGFRYYFVTILSFIRNLKGYEQLQSSLQSAYKFLHAQQKLHVTRKVSNRFGIKAACVPLKKHLAILKSMLLLWAWPCKVHKHNYSTMHVCISAVCLYKLSPSDPSRIFTVVYNLLWQLSQCAHVVLDYVWTTIAAT